MMAILSQPAVIGNLLLWNKRNQSMTRPKNLNETNIAQTKFSWDFSQTNTKVLTKCPSGGSIQMKCKLQGPSS